MISFSLVAELDLTLQPYDRSEGANIIKLSNGLGYVATALGRDDSGGDPLLVRLLDPDGDIKWVNTISDVFPCKSDCLIEDEADSSVVVAGYSSSRAPDGFGKITKLDARTGETIWENRLEFEGWNTTISAVIKKSDSELIVVGNFSRANPDYYHWLVDPKGFIARVQLSDGKFLGEIVESKSNLTFYESVAMNSSGSILVSGMKYQGVSSLSRLPKDPLAYFEYFDSNLNSLRSQTKFRTESGSFSRVISSGEDFVLLGNVSGRYFIHVIKSSSRTRTIDLPKGHQMHSILAVEDGYVVAGVFDKKVTLLRVNQFGVEQWRRSYQNGESEVATAFDVDLSVEGGFIITGASDRKWWTFTTDSQGQKSSG